MWQSEAVLRVVSGTLLAPPAFVLIAAGGYPLAAAISVCGMIAMAEWLRMTYPGRPVGILPFATVVLCAVTGSSGHAEFYGFALAGSFLALASRGYQTTAAAGVGYISAGVGGFALCGSSAFPRGTSLWIFAVICLADITAYLIGRTFGGPKLAPRISPGKIISGLLGAMAGGALGGFAAAPFWGPFTTPETAAMVGCILGAVGQAGDLLESLVKRRAGVKNSSSLIPGHGGILDRLDALIAVCVILPLLMFAFGVKS